MKDLQNWFMDAIRGVSLDYLLKTFPEHGAHWELTFMLGQCERWDDIKRLIDHPAFGNDARNEYATYTRRLNETSQGNSPREAFA